MTAPQPAWLAPLSRPTLLLDPRRARRNLRRMSQRLAAALVTLRPHFKTHQSAALGEWFRDEGVTGITVSSVDMARYFVAAGWTDVTLAFPVNLRQLPELVDLAAQARLGLVADDEAVATALSAALTKAPGAPTVRLWIKIDAGYGRAGLDWQRPDPIAHLARAVTALPGLDLAGLLAHAGHSYRAGSPADILAIHDETVARMTGLRDALAAQGLPAPLLVSIGDTPCCSLAPPDRFAGIDEVRPGNFVFYDLTQAQLGACADDDLAVALACPVVGVYSEPRKLVLHGGAVHLSKDVLADPTHGPVYGYLAQPTADGWTPPDRRCPLVSLSQEHAVVTVAPDAPFDWRPGDLAIVLPVHSCLTADLHARYVTPTGDTIPRYR